MTSKEFKRRNRQHAIKCFKMLMSGVFGLLLPTLCVYLFVFEYTYQYEMCMKMINLSTSYLRHNLLKIKFMELNIYSFYLFKF